MLSITYYAQNYAGIIGLGRDVFCVILQYDLLLRIYCKQGKIRWAKLLQFSRFSGVLRKFFREFKHLSLIILNNEYLWPRQC